MQRAMELAVSFAHTRPDGTSCFTAYTEFGYTNMGSFGENIATGWSDDYSADTAFTSWQETNEKYTGQGHRRNMLSADYTVIGIAGIKIGSYQIYVQEFGGTNTGEAQTAAVDSVQVKAVRILNSNLTVKAPKVTTPNMTIKVGESAIPGVTMAYYINSHFAVDYITAKLEGITWFLSNDNVSVANGVVTGVSTGTCTLQSRVNGTDLLVNVTVVGKPIADAAVSMDSTSYTYNSTVQKPAVTSVVLNGSTLTVNTDYTVSYSNDSSAEPGTYDVIIQGIGDYGGKVTKHYTIAKRTIADGSAQLSADSFVYTGSTQKPSVTNLTAGGMQLTEGTDYKVTYPSASANAGSYQLTITATGTRYTGTLKVPFAITAAPAADTAVTLAKTRYLYTGKDIVPVITVKLNGKTIASTNYDVSYSPDNHSAGTVTVTLAGKNNLQGTTSTTFEIKNTPVISPVPVQYYTGSALKPDLEIKDGEYVLQPDKDYTASYSNNTKQGMATVSIKYLQDYAYAGTASVKFSIVIKLLGVKIDGGSDLAMEAGTVQQLKAVLIPAIASGADLIWSSSDAETVSVSGTGEITAVKAGNAVITLASSLDSSVTASVNVTVVPAAKVFQFAATDKTTISAELNVGETTAVAYQAEAYDGTALTVQASCDPQIAEVSVDENARTVAVKATAAGKAAVSIAYGQRVLTYQINVYPFDKTMKMTAAVSGYDAAGAEPGETHQMLVQAGGTAVDAGLIRFSSSNEKIASVAADGTVTFHAAGSATIKAEALNDPRKRSVSVSVRGIARQVRAIKLQPVQPEGVSMTLTGGDDVTEIDADAADSGVLGSTIPLKAVLYGWDPNTHVTDSAALTGTKVIWTSSDSSVVSVSVKNGDSTAVIKKAGEVLLTATSQDQIKTSRSMRVIIKNYAPVLETDQYVLNRLSTAGTPIGIHDAYGASISSIAVYENGQPSENFTVTGSDNTFVLNLKEGGNTVNGQKYAAVLQISTMDGTTARTFQMPISIRIAAAKPSVKAAVSGSVNAYTGDASGCLVTIAAKDSQPEGSAEVYDKTGANPVSYLSVDANGAVTVNDYAALQKAGANQVTLKLKLQGYTDPVLLKVTIPLKNSLPAYRLDRSSAVLYTYADQDAQTVEFHLIDPVTKQVADLTGFDVVRSADSTGISSIALSSDKKAILVQVSKNAVKASVKFTVKKQEWTKALNYSVQITTVSAQPSVSLSAASIRLNALLTATEAEHAALNVSVSGRIANLTLAANAANAVWINTSTGSADDNFSFSQSGQQILVSINKAVKGSYTYEMEPHLTDGSSRDIIGRKIRLRIQVYEGKPSAAVTSSGVINPVDRSESFARLKFSLKNINASVATAEMNDDRFELVSQDGAYSIREKDGAALSSGSYTCLISKITMTGSGYQFENIPVKVTVREKLPVLKSSPAALNMYGLYSNSAKDIGTVHLTLAGMAGAKISSVTLKNSAALKGAFTFTESSDHTDITIQIADSAAVKSGSTQVLNFQVLYEGQAAGSKASGSFRVSVKDRSNQLRAK